MIKNYIILLLLTINISCKMSNNDDNATISALIKTNKGDITTELFFKKTPVVAVLPSAIFIAILKSTEGTRTIPLGLVGKNLLDFTPTNSPL